jgi:ACS family tartrate transporter-like MFS transporter
LVFEIPGCLIVERWSARKWFTRIMVSWGLITVLMAFIRTPMHFYVVRILLGAAEAGFFPGIIVYLSHWFRASDRAKAGSIFMIAIPVANMLGSVLASWLLGVHWFHLPGWRWLFIVEGIPAIVFGIVTAFYLTDWPREARWLSPEGRVWLTTELEREAAAKNAVRSYKTWEALRQPAVLQLTAIYFCAICGSYGLTIWLPTFLKRASGLSNSTVALLAAVPYLGSLIGMLLNGWHSDRTGERRWHAAIPLLLSAVGFALAIVPGADFRFSYLCLITAALTNSFLPAFWAIPYSFLSDSAAASSTGLINSLGNLGGFAAPFIVGYLRERTQSFAPGFLFIIACLLLGFLLTLNLPKASSAEVQS